MNRNEVTVIAASPAADATHARNAAKVGIGFGTALAITISWGTNQSILWAILHGICSWFYVIYFALRYR